MKTLYVTDLDRTLLGKNGELSDVSYAALEVLYARGVLVAPVTSRSYSALEVLRGARFRAPYSLLGGARIYDAQTKNLLCEHTYSIEDAKWILNAIKSKGLTPFLYTQNDADAQCIYYEADADEQLRAYVRKSEKAGDHRFCKVESFAERLDEKLFIITVRGEEALLIALRDALLVRGLHAYLYQSIHMDDGHSLEASAVSKRVGVEDLRALTGAQRVVAFGDNGNDEGMFEAADERIAVANATDALKCKADHIIDANDTDAVVRTIFEMEGMEWIF